MDTVFFILLQILIILSDQFFKHLNIISTIFLLVLLQIVFKLLQDLFDIFHTILSILSVTEIPRIVEIVLNLIILVLQKGAFFYEIHEILRLNLLFLVLAVSNITSFTDLLLNEAHKSTIIPIYLFVLIVDETVFIDPIIILVAIQSISNCSHWPVLVNRHKPVSLTIFMQQYSFLVDNKSFAKSLHFLPVQFHNLVLSQFFLLYTELSFISIFHTLFIVRCLFAKLLQVYDILDLLVVVVFRTVFINDALIVVLVDHACQFRIQNSFEEVLVDTVFFVTFMHTFFLIFLLEIDNHYLQSTVYLLYIFFTNIIDRIMLCQNIQNIIKCKIHFQPELFQFYQTVQVLNKT